VKEQIVQSPHVDHFAALPSAVEAVFHLVVYLMKISGMHRGNLTEPSWRDFIDYSFVAC